MVAGVSHRLGKAECVCSAMPGLHFSPFSFPLRRRSSFTDLLRLSAAKRRILY